MDTPDPRAKALQRVDVRPDRWLINVAVAALIGTAYRAAPRDAAAAPAFIPHTRPEGGPLWFAEPHIHLIGDIPDSSAPSAARGIVEGVLFADRVIIESCIGAGQRTLYVSGAFGADPELPAASNHSSAISASATDLIYVSRLLTDSALDRLHTLGIPVRTGQEAPPSRAELEAGIRQRRRSHPRPDGQPRAE